MNKYIKEISSIPLLSEQETFSLLKMVSESKAAKEKLIKANLRLVLSLANKFKQSFGKNYEIDDIINIGVFGLIDAIESFDVNRNIRFSTFAYACIFNYYKNYIEKLRTIKRNDSNDISMQEVIYTAGNGDIITLEDAMIDTDLLPMELVTKECTISELYNSINLLSDDEKKVIYSYFGFVDDTPFTLSDIAITMGISHQRVSQIKDKAVTRIKKQLTRKDVI